MKECMAIRAVEEIAQTRHEIFQTIRLWWTIRNFSCYTIADNYSVVSSQSSGVIGIFKRILGYQFVHLHQQFRGQWLCFILRYELDSLIVVKNHPL